MKVSQRTLWPAGGEGISALHVVGRTFPPLHVSQPGKRTAPHRRYETVPRGEHGRSGDPLILLEARAGDVMAGGGGAAGPAPDVRHQPAGDVLAEIQNSILIPCITL